ncbi:MAG: hypothetical protein DMG68_04730 [Acidobacteria bacterium]|nr:MAG: hypothetical protein DMG68_04730 [Acidobacteriota bacterium]
MKFLKTRGRASFSPSIGALVTVSVAIMPPGTMPKPFIVPPEVRGRQVKPNSGGRSAAKKPTIECRHPRTSGAPMALDTKRVLKPFKKLGKSLKKLPKQPRPEQVHEMRTSSRKVEATVAALGLESTGNGRRLLGEVARVRKPAGKVRDMDVLTAFASTLDVDGERECAVELLEYLGARRYRRARKLRTSVSKYGPGLRRRLRRQSAKIDKLMRKAAKAKADGRNGAADAAALALHLSHELRQPARLDRNTLHPYRLKVKELRNILQLAGDGAEQQFIKELGKVKDVIGEWHDWGELLAIADQALDHDGGCKLIGEIKKIHQQKYDEALTITNRMRNEYLGVRGGRGKPGAEADKPVLIAVSAIAA